MDYKKMDLSHPNITDRWEIF